MKPIHRGVVQVETVRLHGIVRLKETQLPVPQRINVLVGKNNSGKSLLLRQLSRILVSDKTGYFLNGIINSSFSISRTPPELDADVLARLTVGLPISISAGGVHEDFRHTLAKRLLQYGIRSNLAAIVSNVANCVPTAELLPLFPYSRVLRVHAERDVLPEDLSKSVSRPSDRRPQIDEMGKGLTSLLTFVQNDKNEDWRKESALLLDALNSILEPSQKLQSIVCRQTDSPISGFAGTWEVFMEHQDGRLVALSESGSGMKTILLIATLFALNAPTHVDIDDDETPRIWIFEELENNLHPNLLRRLLGFVDNNMTGYDILYLSTHSSIVLDYFAGRDDACVLKVTEDAKVEVVETHFHRHDLLGELGHRPSDLLQANGIIWVEGPSDRTYINKWLDLYSKGEFVEGVHYQCAFFSGALLSHVEFSDSELSVEEFANLLRLNSNVFLVTDSDVDTNRPTIKKAVERVCLKDEGLRENYWITTGTTIEHYIPAVVLAQVLGIPNLPPLEPTEPFWLEAGDCYVKSHTKRKSFNKVEFARQVAEKLRLEDLEQVSDWKKNMDRLVAAIRKWNFMD